MSDLLLGQIYTIGLIIYVICIAGHLIAVRVVYGSIMKSDMDGPIILAALSSVWFIVVFMHIGFVICLSIVDYFDSFKNDRDEGGFLL